MSKTIQFSASTAGNKLIAAFPQSGNLSSYKSFVDSLTKEKSGK